MEVCVRKSENCGQQNYDQNRQFRFMHNITPERENGVEEVNPHDEQSGG
jgi:hypothetical protein